MMIFSLSTRRRLINIVSQICSVLTVCFGLFWLFWILLTLLQYGIPGMSLKVFTQMTPPPGSPGGLLNAIAGTVFMVMLSTLIGTPYWNSCRDIPGGVRTNGLAFAGHPVYK